MEDSMHVIESEGPDTTGDSSTGRVFAAETTDFSTRESRDALLTLARNPFVKTDTMSGDGLTLIIPPIFQTSGIGNHARDHQFQPTGDLRINKPIDKVPLEVPAKSDLGEQRKLIADLARRSMTPNEFEHLQGRMLAFETRAQARGLGSDEIQQTYKQVTRLLEATGSTPLSAEQRRRLATQVMENAAEPTSISQGAFRTCNVTVVESAVYTINPSDAARIVADIALTGKHKGRNGHEVMIDPTPQTDEARLSGDRKDGRRVHASEIFQIAAVNMLYQHTGRKERYYQVTPEGAGDNGERRLDTTGRGIKGSAPGLSDGEIVATARLITGHDRIAMIHAADTRVPHPDVDAISNFDQLNQRLLRAKQEGRFPMIVFVNANLEPIASYYSDMNPQELKEVGAHVVTIIDYHAGPPPSVSLDNQWKKEDDYLGDKKLSLEDLWKTMQFGEKAAAIAQMQVDALRAAGRFDPAREVELLRLQAAFAMRPWYGKPEDAPYTLTQPEIEAAYDRVWEQFRRHCGAPAACSTAQEMLRDALVLGPITPHENTLKRLKDLQELKGIPLSPSRYEDALALLLRQWASSRAPDRVQQLKAVKDFVLTLPSDRITRITSAFSALTRSAT